MAKHKSGVCPICGFHSLNYHGTDYTGDLRVDSVECPECNFWGTEESKVVFYCYTDNEGNVIPETKGKSNGKVKKR